MNEIIDIVSEKKNCLPGFVFKFTFLDFLRHEVFKLFSFVFKMINCDLKSFGCPKPSLICKLSFKISSTFLSFFFFIFIIRIFNSIRVTSLQIQVFKQKLAIRPNNNLSINGGDFLSTSISWFIITNNNLGFHHYSIN